jgi:Ca-activated chloride channel family protein
MLTLKLRYKAPDAPLEQGTSKLLEFPITDAGKGYAQASGDFKFAAAVAGFGMILRDSPHKGTATFASVLELGAEGKGEDSNGYRAEFLQLVEKAKAISGK